MRKKHYGLILVCMMNILELKNEEENINIKYCLHKKIFKNGVVDTTGYTAGKHNR